MIAGLLLAGPVMAGPANTIAWAPSYASARKQAIASHKLILIDFMTDWCMWCQVMDGKVYPVPSVVKAMKQFVPVKLNAERDGKVLAQKYDVTGYPTIIVVDSAGHRINMLDGFEPPPQFTEFLNRTVPEAAGFHALQRAVKMHPNSISLNVKYANDLFDRGLTPQLTTLIPHIESIGGGPQITNIYSEMGQLALGKMEPSLAEVWLLKEIRFSKAPVDQFQARAQLITLYQKTDNKPGMETQLQAIIDIRGLPRNLRDQARQGLAELKAGKPLQ